MLQSIRMNSLLVYIIHLQFLAVLGKMSEIPVSIFTVKGTVFIFAFIGIYNIIRNILIK